MYNSRNCVTIIFYVVVSRSQDTLLEEVCEVDVDFLPVSPSVRNSIYYCFVSAMKTVLERTLSSHKVII